MKSIRHIRLPEYLPQLKELLTDGQEIPMQITGGSMSPFLQHGRDIIFISKPDGNRFRGEMVFYQRQNGQCVMHRIHHIDRAGMLYLVGDAQIEIEGPLSPEAVFGTVKRVVRNGKPLQKGCFWWDFFEKIWIRMLPLRPLAKKVHYLLFARQKRSS